MHKGLNIVSEVLKNRLPLCAEDCCTYFSEIFGNKGIKRKILD
jgi:hypothetical protein